MGRASSRAPNLDSAGLEMVYLRRLIRDCKPMKTRMRYIKMPAAVWLLAAAFLLVSTCNAVGLPLISAVLDNHHTPAFTLAHGKLHLVLNHSHEDARPSGHDSLEDFFAHAHLAHGQADGHDSHFHDVVRDDINGSKRKSFKAGDEHSGRLPAAVAVRVVASRTVVPGRGYQPINVSLALLSSIVLLC